jgi:hypothetical protein
MVCFRYIGVNILHKELKTTTTTTTIIIIIIKESDVTAKQNQALQNKYHATKI